MKFSGSDYDIDLDKLRLSGQVKRIRDLMIDGKFRSLGEIEKITSDPQASISAQLRNLRKSSFGSYTVNKKRVGKGTTGLFEYQLIK